MELHCYISVAKAEIQQTRPLQTSQHPDSQIPEII